ncbi:uncharacterized protein LOC114432243 [Parambassis ranga]|uniref:Uncharacterized protein LOC114432243 n=1 Tax=Parambassis ranga TaxID=210632 RepID=A0A6P7I6D2_9TELE|nr:uncharacterized protein LOC114432243 [Parambassis ranga]XP_028255934.1 uncharacterized protein LOC114432243 [Parambassis ranga]
MCLLWALMIIVCLHFGGLCSAFYVGQSLTVEYGDSVVLPCDGSTFAGEEGTVHWETMGTDVAFLQEGGQKIGPHFEGRIQLPSEEEISKGVWSVFLTQTKLRDSSMYECIWQERKTLSTVWLKVQEPRVEPYRTVHAGTRVDLPCYIESSRIPSNYLEVWWTKDGITLSSMNEGVLPGVYVLNVTEEEFQLQMTPATTDSGKYECWFRTRKSETPRHGIPESITLTVLENIPTESVFEHDETTTFMVDDWVTSPYWYDLSWTEEEPETTHSPLDILPVLLTDSTQPIEVATESQPMEVFEETVTSFPDEGTSETTSFQWDNLPWVRIGLIGGVLLVTSMVLCILGALLKM